MDNTEMIVNIIVIIKSYNQISIQYILGTALSMLNSLT